LIEKNLDFLLDGAREWIEPAQPPLYAQTSRLKILIGNAMDDRAIGLLSASLLL
jgi:hypothetical protein